MHRVPFSITLQLISNTLQGTRKKIGFCGAIFFKSFLPLFASYMTIYTKAQFLIKCEGLSAFHNGLCSDGFYHFKAYGDLYKVVSKVFVKSSSTCAHNFCQTNERSFCTVKASHIFSAKNGRSFAYIMP